MNVKKICIIIWAVIFAIMLSIMIAVHVILYPKCLDIIYKYSAMYHIDPALATSIVKVESNFDPNVTSSAGACGLMQLLPDTAKDMAGRLDMSGFDIFEPEDNIRLGVYYLSYLSTIFDENEVILAYNAGMGSVLAWQKDIKYSSDGKHIDTIPFCETKAYLSRVAKYKHIYGTNWFIGK